MGQPDEELVSDTRDEIKMLNDTARGRSNHSQLLSRVHLFLIDEASHSDDVLPHSKHRN